MDHLNRCKTSFVLMMVGFRDFSLCHSSTLNLLAGGHSISLGLCPTKLPVKWDIQLGQLDVPAPFSNFVNGDRLSQVPACRLNFSFWIMLHQDLPQNFCVNRSQYTVRFSQSDFCQFRQMEQLFFARTKKEIIFIGFPAMSSNSRLSDFKGLFVHDRCTPQQ